MLFATNKEPPPPPPAMYRHASDTSQASMPQVRGRSEKERTDRQREQWRRCEHSIQEEEARCKKETGMLPTFKECGGGVPVGS